MVKISITVLNKIIKNQSNFYDILSKLGGVHLPEMGCRALTDDYLLQVSQDKVFKLKKEKIKYPEKLIRKATVQDLIDCPSKAFRF